MLNDQLVISDVTGPFREPREPVLSYDYSILCVSGSSE